MNNLRTKLRQCLDKNLDEETRLAIEEAIKLIESGNLNKKKRNRVKWLAITLAIAKWLFERLPDD